MSREEYADQEYWRNELSIREEEIWDAKLAALLTIRPVAVVADAGTGAKVRCEMCDLAHTQIARMRGEIVYRDGFIEALAEEIRAGRKKYRDAAQKLALLAFAGWLALFIALVTRMVTK